MKHRVEFCWLLLLSFCIADQCNGDQTPHWLDPDRSAPAGSRYYEFHSNVLDGEASAIVWLPPAYRRFPNATFPVIYFLHGANGNQRTVTEKLIPSYIEAMKKKIAPPAIIVGVNGIPRSFYLNSASGSQPVEDVMIKDLIPSIDHDFRTMSHRGGRMIMGFSMGGFGATRLGFKYLDHFGAIDIISAGPLKPFEQLPPGLRNLLGDRREELPIPLILKNVEKAKENRTMIRVSCGTKDDLLRGNVALHHLLDKHSVDHRFARIEGVSHSLTGILEKQGARFFLFHQHAFK